MKKRIQAIISSAGFCSRRAAEDLISQGRVQVNGTIAELGQSADDSCDAVTIDGKPLTSANKKVYLMLNKPVGIITTMSDEHGRKNVSSLVKDCGCRVYPVGRLDYMSSGLIIMTNDGDLTYALTHPSHEVVKEYTAKVYGDLTEICMQKLCSGLLIDGYKTAPAQTEILKKFIGGGIIKIKIHEGRNRQIRKMCAICGLEVKTLVRTAIGDLVLPPELPAGQWRFLSETETEYLKSL